VQICTCLHRKPVLVLMTKPCCVVLSGTNTHRAVRGADAIKSDVGR